MAKVIPILSAVSLGVISSQAMATYGDNLIGFGPQSRAMGGTGIAMSMGAESALKNPALIHTDNKFSFIFAGSYFMPDVETGITGINSYTSEADKFVIPSIGFTYKIDEQWTFGLGAYGTSGMGVDFSNTDPSAGLARMKTSFSSMKFTPTVAYQVNDNLSVGFGMAIMYGSLGIAYDRAPNTNVGLEGAGSSDDLGTGFDIGVAYSFGDVTVGANYQSKITLEYDRQLSDAALDFGANMHISSDKLAQPAEYGVGIAWQNDALLLTADYKFVDWEDAAGYADFGWDNQNVVAVGAQYTMSNTKFRVGYLYASNPMGANAIGNDTQDMTMRGALNTFNLVGFPATAEAHITAGICHDFSEEFSLDVAFTYAPEVKTTTNVDFDGPGPGPEMNYTNKHSQTVLTIAGHWNF